MGFKMTMTREQMEQNLKTDPGPFKVYSKVLGLGKDDAMTVLLWIFNMEFPDSLNERHMLPFIESIRNATGFSDKQKQYALWSVSYLIGGFTTAAAFQAAAQQRQIQQQQQEAMGPAGQPQQPGMFKPGPG